MAPSAAEPRSGEPPQPRSQYDWAVEFLIRFARTGHEAGYPTADLESRAPGGPSRSAASALRLRLEDLATALQADRKLRLGSTPPSGEQLDYSTSLIHHQVEELQNVLRPADAGQSPGLSRTQRVFMRTG